MEVCDEGVGLRGESQVSNDFPKIVDKIPDDRGAESWQTEV